MRFHGAHVRLITVSTPGVDPVLGPRTGPGSEGVPMPSRPRLRVPSLLDLWTLTLAGMLTWTTPAWANEAAGGPAPGVALGDR